MLSLKSNGLRKLYLTLLTYYKVALKVHNDDGSLEKTYLAIGAAGMLCGGKGLRQCVVSNIMIQECLKRFVSTTLEPFKPNLLRKGEPLHPFYNQKG